jgi:tripartite-type tricarboxylate transporter receptor subunit TctC
VAAVLREPKVRDDLLTRGFEPIGDTPDEFAAFIKASIAQTARIVKDARINLD